MFAAVLPRLMRLDYHETSFFTKLDLLAVLCNEPAFALEEDKTAHLWQNSKHQCALVIGPP